MDVVKRNNEFTQLIEIGSICVDEIVNVEVNVRGSEKPEDSIKIKYGLKSKKELLIYDDSSKKK